MGENIQEKIFQSPEEKINMEVTLLINNYIGEEITNPVREALLGYSVKPEASRGTLEKQIQGIFDKIIESESLTEMINKMDEIIREK